MTVFYPLYYKDFKCIAEKCTHSCCVGWEISVDELTMKEYEDNGREDILCHIKDQVIGLCEDGRCPFLRSDGLCRIIADYGEEYTSLICREHPRFYHSVGNRIEGGIGLSCEEACRVVLSSDCYDEFYELEHTPEVAEETNFDSIFHRKLIYSTLKDCELSYDEKIKRIKEKYGLENPIHTDDEWQKILSKLEYLDESHRGIFTPGERKGETQRLCERFLAYLVFRHISVAENYQNLRARVGFCLLLSSIFEGYTYHTTEFSALCDFARLISEEIEYSEDNTAELIFEIEANLF